MLAKLERLMHTPLQEVGERRVTLFGLYPRFLHLLTGLITGGNGAVKPALVVSWRENPLRSGHLYQKLES